MNFMKDAAAIYTTEIGATKLAEARTPYVRTCPRPPGTSHRSGVNKQASSRLRARRT